MLYKLAYKYTRPSRRLEKDMTLRRRVDALLVEDALLAEAADVLLLPLELVPETLRKLESELLRICSSRGNKICLGVPRSFRCPSPSAPKVFIPQLNTRPPTVTQHE